ncbi:MAG: hypothetical protein ACE5SW_10125 [Nitrososphaeraceae archaeon]
MKKNINKPSFYDDDTLSKMRNYYNIEDHTDLLKFIKRNGLHNNDDIDNSYREEKNNKRIRVNE